MASGDRTPSHRCATPAPMDVDDQNTCALQSHDFNSNMAAHMILGTSSRRPYDQNSNMTVDPSSPGSSSSSLHHQISTMNADLLSPGNSSSRPHEQHSDVDAELLIPALRQLYGFRPNPPPAPRSSYRPLLHPKLIDPKSTTLPNRARRDWVPQELVALLAQGYSGDLSKGASTTDDDTSEDRSLPPEHRLSLRIAQSLTLARNYDHTFSIEHLSTRDMLMVDAFLRHAFYTTMRDWVVDEAYVPTEAEMEYPPIKKYSIYLIIQAYKGLDAATRKLIEFNNSLSQASEEFKNPAKLLKLNEELTTFSPSEDNKELVDMLSHYHVSIACIKLVCVTASTATAQGYTNLKHIGNALARLYHVDPTSSAPAESVDIPTAEELDALYSKVSQPQQTPHRDTPSIRTVEVTVEEPPRKSSRQADQRSERSVPVTMLCSPAPHQVDVDVKEQQQLRSSPRMFQFSAKGSITPTTALVSLTDRCLKAVTEGRCLRCLYVHTPGHCQRAAPCRICHDVNHHPAICPRSSDVKVDVSGDIDIFFDAMWTIYRNVHNKKH
ncbi:hypothetical protein OSTOST_01958 [Ostertagia ostertagi]